MEKNATEKKNKSRLNILWLFLPVYNAEVFKHFFYYKFTYLFENLF